MEDKKRVKSGDFVIPGDYLGEIEEYLPGRGVKEEEGKLIATTAGRVVIDKERMEIHVEPASKTPPKPKVGDVVIAQVVEVKPQAVIVQVIRMEENKEREIATPRLAGIHISQIKDGFVEDITKEFKVGDVVRARVIANEKIPIQLTTKEPDLGVVYAYCSKCRTPLIRRGDKLICPRCGNVETRKLSRRYRRITL